MIKIENVELGGVSPAIRGMRNPKNSWGRSDTYTCASSDIECDECSYRNYGACKNDSLIIGPNDLKLAKTLARGGPVHAKYRRMMVVWVDITAPLYFWKEFDTYKVGTVSNSCSTMHKLTAKPFELDDFSHEHLSRDPDEEDGSVEMIGQIAREYWAPSLFLEDTIKALNCYRKRYIRLENRLKEKDILPKERESDTIRMKKIWYQMIQLLPSSYNQRRTIMLDYEVLANMYRWRKDHKLDEWVEFCKWIETLPYSELITQKEVLNNA